MSHDDKKAKRGFIIFMIIFAVVMVSLGIINFLIFTGGKIKTDPKTGDSDNLFDQGLLCAKSGDKYGYIDATGTYVINPQFEKAAPFGDQELACVKQDGKFGYIDKSGIMIIDVQFDGAGAFTSSGLALVKRIKNPTHHSSRISLLRYE